MLGNIFKMYIKIIRNKKITYFFALFTLLLISFIIANPQNDMVQFLAFLLNFQIIRIFIFIKVIFISYYNLPLGLLHIIILSIILSIKLDKLEEFDNIPNLVNKDKILKYNKNFKVPKKLTDIKTERKEDDPKDAKTGEKEVKIKKKQNRGHAISLDLYNDNKGHNKDNKEKKNVEEVNLEEVDDTIENELKGKLSHQFKKLDEYDSSSSDSSGSNSSDSSTDSSDSDKEIEEVSMTKAREHMLNKLRDGLKKRYIHD
jgi:hypothetical protein